MKTEVPVCLYEAYCLSYVYQKFSLVPIFVFLHLTSVKTSLKPSKSPRKSRMLALTYEHIYLIIFLIMLPR